MDLMDELARIANASPDEAGLKEVVAAMGAAEDKIFGQPQKPKSVPRKKTLAEIEGEMKNEFYKIARETETDIYVLAAQQTLMAANHKKVQLSEDHIIRMARVLDIDSEKLLDITLEMD